MTQTTVNGKERPIEIGAPSPATAQRASVAGSVSVQDTDRFTWGQVAVGVTRFMELARERQGLDAEWEFQEMCERGCGYPSAIHGLCFSCQSSARIIS